MNIPFNKPHLAGKPPHNMRFGNRYIFCIGVLLFNALFFALVAYLLPMRFEENDDVVMCMIANGVYSGSPDCHLVFINAIYGSVLAWLYSLSQAIEWYTLSFSIIHIVSMSVLVWCILLDKEHNRWIKAVFLLFLYVIWVRIILSFQFTTTAGLACVAGCVLLLHRANRCQIFGGGLVLISSLIRFHVAGLVVLLFIPLFLYTIKLNYKRYIPMVLIGFLVLFCHIADNLFYQTQEWGYYKEYNTLRGKINDNPNAFSDEVLGNLPIGVSEADYQLLCVASADPNIMTLNVLKQIDTSLESVSIIDKWHNVKALKSYITAILIAMIVMGIAVLGSYDKGRKIGLSIVALLVVAIMVFVALNATLKNRVFLCILIATMTIVYHWMHIDNRIAIITLCVAIVGLSAFYAKQTYEVGKWNASGCVNWNKNQISLVSQLPDEARLLMLVADMKIEYTPPFHIKEIPYHFCVLGWMTANPLNNQLSSHKALIDPNVYIFMRNTGYTPMLLTHIREQIQYHYGLQTELSVFAENQSYAIVQLKSY